MPDPIEMTVATIRYRNYRGEITTRRIIPYDLSFRATEHHPLPQWIIDAWDLDKPGGKVSRSFAVADILEWERGSRTERRSPIEQLVEACQRARAAIDDAKPSIGLPYGVVMAHKILDDIIARAEGRKPDGLSSPDR